MKKKPIIITLAIVILAFLGWFFFLKPSPVVTTFTSENPYIGHIAETVTATGTIQPVDTVAVGTQVSGTVQAIYADYNSVVKKGQLLAVLDQSLFIASVDQAKGNLAAAESNLNYQTSNLSRQKQLFAVGAISQADYDNAVYTYNSAKASVSTQNASLATAEKNLSLSKIYSPIDGTVLSRNVSEGQTVAASFSTPTLFTIAKDLKKMQVQASVDEADVGNINDSERVTFTVDAFLGQTFEGRVQEIRLSPTTSSNVVTYTTIINAPNNDLKLKPGMTASIIIYTSEADSALLIPEKAASYSPSVPAPNAPYSLVKAADTSALKDNERFVWIRKDNQLVQKRITVGLDDNTKIQVLSGLATTDQVVTAEAETTVKEASAAEGASPFMPHRPKRNTKKK